MAFSRRDFGRLALGSGAAAALGTVGLSTATAQQSPDFRAIVTIFLYGGNDGWNSLVPIDTRHATYASLRGPSLALAVDDLVRLGDTGYGMHPSLAPLKEIWDAGAMNWVLNVGTLVKPITREIFWADPSSRPSNLSSHSHEQEHWQSMRPGSVHPDGVLGRMADGLPLTSAASPLISTNGDNLALMGRTASPLILPLYTSFERVGWEPQNGDPVVQTRMRALEAFAKGPHESRVQELTSATLDRSYAAAALVNPILREASTIDHHFEQEPGVFRDTQMSRQLRLIARSIAAASSLGHGKQVFYAGQGDYDTHANQVAGGRVLGAHADLLTDLAVNLRSFYRALRQLGLQDKVTVVTMSDFGRTYRGNGSAGSDHAWGNALFAIGGALRPQMIHGRYPSLNLAGDDSVENEGTFIPTISNEEYVGAVARWFGVQDMGYVFPNWSRWSTNGRGPVPMFA
jgi:uncharacterized protein (DUF1501 family)